MISAALEDLDVQRAWAPEARSQDAGSIWEEPVFAARFESIVLFTNRPSLVRQLMDLPDDINDKVLRRHIRQVELRFHLDRRVARGKQALFSTSMRKPIERYHASILFALMHNVGLEEAVNDGVYVDHMVEIYQRYLLLTGSRLETATIDFEAMMEIRAAIVTSQVSVLNCSNCGAQHISHSPDSSCPFCLLHEHEDFNLATQINQFHSSFARQSRHR